VAEIRECRAVVLDLFDTIVTWNPELMPQVHRFDREGRPIAIRSTALETFAVLQQVCGERYLREHYLDAHDAVLAEIYAERSNDMPVEITCLERFMRILNRLEFGAAGAEELANRLRAVHMGWVRKVTAAPAARVAAVEWIAQRYRLGLLSNFDDGETGHMIVADAGVDALFETVVISADIGLRKPHPQSYHHLLETMSLAAEEILFVGDDPLCDVFGPKRVGMRTAWINRQQKPLPEGVSTPDLIIGDLAELPAALGL